MFIFTQMWLETCYFSGCVFIFIVHGIMNLQPTILSDTHVCVRACVHVVHCAILWDCWVWSSCSNATHVVLVPSNSHVALISPCCAPAANRDAQSYTYYTCTCMVGPDMPAVPGHLCSLLYISRDEVITPPNIPIPTATNQEKIVGLAWSLNPCMVHAQ